MDFRSLLSRLPGPFRVLLIITAVAAVGTAVAAVGVLALYHFLSPERYGEAPWLPQVAVTLFGLGGASWFAHRRLELLDQNNHQRKQAADEQLAATERGNLNDAIKEADDMMSKPSLSSIIAGQRWLHHLAEDDRLDAGLIRSLLCAHIASSDPAFVSHDADSDGAHVSNETRQRIRQAVFEMVFGSPGRNRYSHCQDKPDLGSCTWRGLDFTDLCVADVNFRKSDFTDAQISGACFDRSDLRETKWGPISVGGSARTYMRGVEMCGAQASSFMFENIDFTDANMSNNGLTTRFWHCTFKHCDFTGASWSGLDLSTAKFEDKCDGINFELCRDAIVKGASGLPNELVEELRRKGVGGY